MAVGVVRERQTEGIVQAKKGGVYTGRKEALATQQMVDIRDLVPNRN